MLLFRCVFTVIPMLIIFCQELLNFNLQISFKTIVWKVLPICNLLKDGKIHCLFDQTVEWTIDSSGFSLSGVFLPLYEVLFSSCSHFLPVDSTHGNTASSNKIYKTWIFTNNRASKPSSGTTTRWVINHEMRVAEDGNSFRKDASQARVLLFPVSMRLLHTLLRKDLLNDLGA